MYRSRRRSYRRPVRAIKYSSETWNDVTTFNWNSLQPDNNYSFIGTGVDFVGASNVSGMRKVKNFTIEINPTLVNANNELVQIPFLWAIVYVPEGQNPSPNFGNNSGGGSLYEPNQNVIMSGTGVTSQSSYRKYTRLARNLNSGDRIYILFRLFDTLNIGANANYKFYMGTSINYAICYS